MTIDRARAPSPRLGAILKRSNRPQQPAMVIHPGSTP